MGWSGREIAAVWQREMLTPWARMRARVSLADEEEIESVRWECEKRHRGWLEGSTSFPRRGTSGRGSWEIRYETRGPENRKPGGSACTCRVKPRGRWTARGEEQARRGRIEFSGRVSPLLLWRPSGSKRPTIEEESIRPCLARYRYPRVKCTPGKSYSISRNFFSQAPGFHRRSWHRPRRRFFLRPRFRTVNTSGLESCHVLLYSFPRRVLRLCCPFAWVTLNATRGSVDQNASE